MLSHLRDRVADALLRAEEVDRLLSDPDTVRDSQKLAGLGREHHRLAGVVSRAHRLDKLQLELAEVTEMAEGADEEMAAEAEAEKTRLTAEQKVIYDELLPLLIPRDPLDDRPSIVEIRAGTGGDEAALFAADLYRMYTRFIERRGWKIETISHSEGTLQGVKEAIFKVIGDGVFGVLRWESGVHRVQRVPATENQGRIHTSAATVAVLPEAEEVDVRIEDKDLRIDVFRSSGPGGQSVNTTDSAVRITHIPTGLVVSQQDQKSQLQNKAKGMEVLRARLLDLRLSEQEAERSRQRRSQVSTGDRSGENSHIQLSRRERVTDHRVGVTLYDIDRVMDGDLKPFLDALALANAEEAYNRVSVATQLTARSILREAERTLMSCRDIHYAHDSNARHRAAREIVAALTQQSPGDVSRGADSPIGELVREAAIAAAARHAAGEPLAYAVGSAAFRHLVLHVDRRVLIPRPESEIVVEEALRLAASTPGGIAVDIGTGSGAIALSLAAEGHFDRVIATDISADALAVASENVHRVPASAAPVEFRLGADFEPLLGIKARVLVSNPPYIAFAEATALPASVRDWEPSLALFADNGGMARYEALVTGAAQHLEPGGWLVLEVDSGRAHETAQLAQNDGRYSDIRILQDLTGRDRVLVARLPRDTSKVLNETSTSNRSFSLRKETGLTMLEDKAKDLGRTIGQSPEYKAVKKSSEALNEDRESSTLLRQMEGIRNEAQAMMDRGLQPTPEMEQQLDALLEQVQTQTAYQRAVVAQDNFDKLMLRVNTWIADGIKAGATSSIILG